MDIKIVKKELDSPALREIAETIDSVVVNTKAGKLTIQQSYLEMAGAKHLIQCIALDWHYQSRRNGLGRVGRKMIKA